LNDQHIQIKSDCEHITGFLANVIFTLVSAEKIDLILGTYSRSNFRGLGYMTINWFLSYTEHPFNP